MQRITGTLFNDKIADHRLVGEDADTVVLSVRAAEAVANNQTVANAATEIKVGTTLTLSIRRTAFLERAIIIYHFSVGAIVLRRFGQNCD
jgi:hypothetical protein